MNGKKFLSVALALSILLAASVNVYASNANFSTTNNEQTIIRFDEQEYANLSAYDAGVAKLLDSGHTIDFINSMPQKTVASIAATEQAVQSTKYFVEEKNGSSTYLRESSPQEYNLNSLRPKIVDPDSITVMDADGNVLYCPNSENKGRSTTTTIDNGSVLLKTTLYSVDSPFPSQYLAVSEFIWTAMPAYRSTDFFGLTRDSKTVTLPNSYGSYFAYDTLKYLYFATPNGITQTEQTSPPTTSNDSLANQDADDPHKGYAIEVAVPGNINPPPVMLPNSAFTAYYHYALSGEVYYEGILGQPSIVPTWFNRRATYLHQKSFILLGSPSVSIPLGGAISVNLAAQYSDAATDEVTHVWEYEGNVE